MPNSLKDLTAHLFAQLERLDVESLTPDQIDAEAKRTDAIVKIADQITHGMDLQLKAARLFADHGAAILPMLPQIGQQTKGTAE